MNMVSEVPPPPATPCCRGDTGREALSAWMGLALFGWALPRLRPQALHTPLPSSQWGQPGWGGPNPVRTEEGSDPKEFENFPVRRKGLDRASTTPLFLTSASFPLSPTALGAPSPVSPWGPAGLCHLRGRLREPVPG